ncbi:transglutaminase domain-containing protein [Catonella massiliensis]|uniref:Transglutaminase-like domain-containing protein n=1 Tax=Catonella massiliensis TaxID=2799636 RepID=A0ABS1J164_9FIRM|nr:transglutaminase domain-containing protein [Catonella massiliensis]MBK5897795.1 hypothetical protein [Catonella massiliensis]
MSMKNNLKKVIFSLLFSFALVAVISGNVECVNAGTKAYAKRTYKKKTVVLKSKKAVSKKITKGLAKFDKKITFCFSKKLFKNNMDFWNTLHSNTEYKDLYGRIECSMSWYNLYGYDRIDLFVKYKTTKSKFKKFKSGIIRTEKEFIDRMVKNAKDLKRSFSISVSKKVADIMNVEASRRLFNKLYDEVEFMDMVSKGYTTTSMNYGTYWTLTVKNNYDITKSDVKNLDKFVKAWVAENLSTGMTDAEKVKKIFEYMTMEYAYSYGDKGEDWYYTGDNNRNAKLGKYDVHTSFALVFKQAGVCSGYSRLFYRFAKEARLEVIYIVGKTAIENSAGHAWNMVKVDGNWYHIDVTWGRGKYNNSNDVFIDWNYFLKGDSTMGDEEHIHVWDRDKYPAAAADYVEPDEMEDYDGTDDESDEETTDEIPIPDYIGTDVINF